MDRPIPVPDAVLKVLRRASTGDLPGEHLLASAVQLDGPTEVDIVVPVLAGSHATFFYILRPSSDGYQLIFDVGGDNLTVPRTRSHGDRDLKVVGITMAGTPVATIVYRFDGHNYQDTEREQETRIKDQLQIA